MNTYIFRFVAAFFLATLLNPGATTFAQNQIVNPQSFSTSANIETPTSIKAQTTNSQRLVPFGYNLFDAEAAPSDKESSGILPANYRLGPGDQLGIFLGGKTQQHFDVLINFDGQMYMPNVGVFQVMGLTINAMTKLLDQRLTLIYSDYDINVILVRPKKVWVSVVGEVRFPGNYSLSALNSVLDAIVMAKGLTANGSLRDIQIYRGDSFITNVDLYDFLLLPKANPNYYLQNGDKIFIPVVRSRISVHGQVNRPAIYELNPRKSETICDMVSLAGGFTDLAFEKKVELSRLRENGRRQVFYLDFEKLNCTNENFALTTLENNDRVTVFSIKDQLPKQVVTIHGEVNYPGEYEFEENMNVSDLILNAGSLTRSAYVLKAELAKVDPKTSVKTIAVDLQAILANNDSSSDLPLEPDDHVFIRRIPEWELGPTVTVQGEVMFPGSYSIVKDSTTLREILEKTGGFTKDALVGESKLLRQRAQILEDKEYERLKILSRDEMSLSEYEYLVMKQNTENVREIVVDFFKLMVKRENSEDIVLKNGDMIIIPKRPNVVYVSGRVSNPGGVLYKAGADFKYYISKAGGFTWDANSRKSRIIKVSGEIINDEDVKRFEAGDRIWVPRKPDRNYWQIFRDTMLVAGQLAAVFLVIQNTMRN